MTGMEGSGTVSLNDAERELILSRLNGGDDERVFVNWADVIDFLRVEIKKMRSGRQEQPFRCWVRFWIRLNLAEMR